MKYFILLTLLISSLFSDNLLICSTDAMAKRDYSFKNKTWGNGIELDKSNTDFGILNKQTPKGKVLKKYIFSNIDTLSPSVKVITNYENPKQEIITNFKAKRIHTSSNFILIQWGIVDYNIWIASINMKYKQATISNHYNGLTSYGISSSSLDCK